MFSLHRRGPARLTLRQAVGTPRLAAGTSRQAVGVLTARGVEATGVADGTTAWAREGLPVTEGRGTSGGAA